MGIQMKDPGALAGATGAAIQSARKRDTNTLAELQATQDRHGRVCRMLGHALALDNPEAWTSLSYVAHSRLKETEMAMAVYALMRPLSPRMRQRIFEAAQWGLCHEA